MPFEPRPLNLPDLLGRCFSIYFSHLLLFAGIMSTPSLLSLLFTLPLQALSLRRLDMLRTPPDPMAILGLAAATLLFLLVVSVAYMVVYMLAIGAATEAVSALYGGRTLTLREAYEAARARLWPLVVVSINISSRLLLVWIVVLAVMAGLTIPLNSMSTTGVIALVFVMGLLLIAGLVATFLMFLRYALAVPALLVEGVGPGAAVARSVALSRGTLGRIFVVIACSILVAVVAVGVVQTPFLIAGMVADADSLAGIGLAMAGTIAAAVAGAVTSPLLVIGQAVLYFDARVRIEPGFTLLAS